jgi:D-hexose-6-phosphate mutarotase
MEAQQHEQLRSQAAFNQELRQVQKQQYIDIMAALRGGNPIVHPTIPTRTSSGHLGDAGHVPQLQWQSDGADDYDQQLLRQLHKQHDSNYEGKTTPSRSRHVSHDTNARYGGSAPYCWHSQKLELFPELTLLQCCCRPLNALSIILEQCR